MINEVKLRGIFRTKSNITMELFSLRLSHILKTCLIWLNCLKVPFVTQLTLSWKTYNSENFGRKSFLLTTGHFFFRNSKLRNGTAPSINRGSHRRCSIRKGVLRNFAKFTGKHLSQVSLFIQLQASLQLY